MKTNTLKENKDFRRLYYRGKSEASPVLVTYAMKSKKNHCSYGITTSKKIGKAVERNRARRVIRVAFSNLASEINGNWDFVFVARSRTTCVKEQEVEKAMRKSLKSLGIINDKS